MTAEIAVMNKEAIALAADSAVTLSEEMGQKIFTSGNKIFALSKYRPVGIMIYGNANFMGVPWETIIKIYRGKLGKKKFDALKEYADDFIDFLNAGHELFPESIQEEYFRSHIYNYFHYIKREIEQRVEETISEKEIITAEEIREITSKTIKKHYDAQKDAELLPLFTKEHIETLIEKYQPIIDKAKKEVFKNLPIDEILSRQLEEIGVSLFTKSWLILPDYSGVVIAGFGTMNIFPSLRAFLIEGMVNNHLKYKEVGHSKITFQNDAEIIPFAQQEMVHAFMEGVEKNYQNAIERDLSQIFAQYPEIIVDDIEKLNEDEKSDLKKRLKEISSNMLSKYIQRLEDYRRENYIEPIMKVVAILPKDELAAMAESLVNLTSFKRRVSIEAETVGGPIDVAVISKGDGLIWIKRKHYFKAELNPHFFENYFKEVQNEEQAE